ncbi:MAG: hypothetical protein WBI07_10930 [Mobilitalea sp.]
MVEIGMKTVIGIMLFACGIQDMYKKKIALWMVAAGAVFIGICVPFSETFSIWDRVGGIAVGVGVVLISIATAGKIGLGDGLILCVTGLGLGFWGNMELFAVSLFAAAIISIILLILHKADRKKSIPFVPFLMVGYIILIIATKKAG